MELFELSVVWRSGGLGSCTMGGQLRGVSGSSTGQGILMPSAEINKQKHKTHRTLIDEIVSLLHYNIVCDDY